MFYAIPWLYVHTYMHVIEIAIACMHAFGCCRRIRLRQESELLSRSSSQHWSQSDLQSYASTTNLPNENDAALVQSSDSLSSTETLKWLGSMSDISSSSHATNTSHISASGNYLLFVIRISYNIEFYEKKRKEQKNGSVLRPS